MVYFYKTLQEERAGVIISHRTLCRALHDVSWQRSRCDKRYSRRRFAQSQRKKTFVRSNIWCDRRFYVGEYKRRKRDRQNVLLRRLVFTTMTAMRTTIVVFCALSVLYGVSAFYLPGLAPVNYCKAGETLKTCKVRYTETVKTGQLGLVMIDVLYTHTYIHAYTCVHNTFIRIYMRIYFVYYILYVFSEYQYFTLFFCRVYLATYIKL